MIGAVIGVCTLIGIIGTLGMTWLFPMLSTLCSTPRGSQSRTATSNQATSLCVVIPAHNEERHIAATISSILASWEQAEKLHCVATLRILVVANCCTDATAEIATEFPSVEVLHYDVQPSKWASLGQGVAHASDATWVAFVDAGIVWDKTLFAAVAPHLQDSSLAGIAPSYKKQDSSYIETVVWHLEAHLKSLEQAVGGPISVHGATVFYRNTCLKRALALLSHRAWLHDDVVVPLALRTVYPEKSILYLPRQSVYDHSSEALSCEDRRRVRLVRGNIDWMKADFWRGGNPITFWLALRRVFRMMWAFWLMLLLAPLLLLGWPGCTAFAILLCLLTTRVAAFRIGLCVPVLLCAFGREQVTWK